MTMNEARLEEIPHACVLQMQAVYESLKSAERKAADYLLGNPRKVSGLNIVDFAADAGCSEATVVRLSKKLGYEGYPELKRDFSSYQEGEKLYEYENISSEDDPLETMRKVFESSIQGLQDTLEMIDTRQYLAAVEAVGKAGSLMFTGVGDAGAVAMEAYQRYLRIGRRSLFSADGDTQLIYANQLLPGDVLIAVSHSGRSKSVVDTVKVAADRGATTIAVTNFPVSPLSKRSDIVLQTAVFSRNLTGEVMSKRVTALCIIESLYMNTLLHSGKETAENLARSNDIVSINKM